MLIADSHEFIELYRGDKDLRLGCEMVRLRDDLRVVSFAPDAVSPMERRLVGTRRLSDVALPPLPDRVELRLLPAVPLRFARKEGGGIFAWMPGYARALAAARPDIVMESVYTWLTPRSYATDRVARRFGIPVVYYDPGDDVPVNARQRAVLDFERPVVNRAAGVITYNEVGKRRIVTKYGYPAERVHVIPKPVDVARWRVPEVRDEARAALGIAPGAFVVAHAGRLTRLRGSVVLAEAAHMAATDPRFDGVTFLFIGGALNSAADAAVFEGPNTVVTGMVPNDRVPAMLAAADVVVFPDLSSHAGFTTALAEAMAAALPLVVGFDPVQGAVPLRPDVSVECIEPGSAEAILGAVARLRDDPARRAALAEAAGKVALERMDYPRVAAVWLDLLEGVLAGV